MNFSFIVRHVSANGEGMIHVEPIRQERYSWKAHFVCFRISPAAFGDPPWVLPTLVKRVNLSQGHVLAPSSRPHPTFLLTFKQCSLIGALLVIYFQRFFHQLKSTFICSSEKLEICFFVLLASESVGTMVLICALRCSRRIYC